MSMKLHQLRALVAVADQGSIVGASRILFVSQPAITKAIRELESDLGITLLERSVSGVTLTTVGEALLQRARLIVSELERAEEQMAREKGALEGRITVGVTPLAGLSVLPEAYAHFRQKLPEVRVDFLEQTSTKLIEGLRSGALDFALAASPEASQDPVVRCAELLSFPTEFAVRKGGVLARAKSLEDLIDAEWLHTDTTNVYPNYVASLFNDHKLSPPQRITRCTSQALLYNFSLAFDSVIWWSLHSLNSSHVGGQYCKLDFIKSHRQLKLFLMRREGVILTQPSDYLIRCIFEVAGERKPAPKSKSCFN